MAKRVFYSFHYKPDNWRVSQVRQMGALEGNQLLSDNDWEQVVRAGDASIQRWIDNQMIGKSCTVVLIGSRTASRKWVKYEIEKAWGDGKGVVGIYVHNLEDRDGNQTTKGSNPLANVIVDSRGRPLSAVAKAYDPSYLTGKGVYKYIQSSIVRWVEEAITIRTNFKS